MSAMTRRQFLRTSGVGLGVGALSAGCAASMTGDISPKSGRRVVVIGGGWGGASAAKYLRLSDPSIEVVLLEPSERFVSCPFSNLVLSGVRTMDSITRDYQGLRRHGVKLIHREATAIEPDTKRVRIGEGYLQYDRLVVAPGIEFQWEQVEGLAQAKDTVLHAWKAGPQTVELARQLQSMADGGVFVLTVPPVAYRCPPGPYERACQVAWYLKTKKPRSKLIVLDAKDAFSKQKLFQNAWKELYPGMIEWVSLSQGGKVNAVDPATNTLITDFGNHTAKVANVIPPQRAGRIAGIAGAADNTGWCAIDPVTFESKSAPNIHVIGDACIGGGMPKSAFSANAQAKACAGAVATLLAGGTPAAPKLINTCYSLAAPDYGISVAGVYAPKNGLLADVEGAGGVSPADAPREFRVREADYAQSWFATITAEVFG